MTRVIGVVVPSFSLREREPNPCNVRLADEAIRISGRLIARGYLPLVVAQWEVELAMKRVGKFREYEAIDYQDARRGVIPYGRTINQSESGKYLDTSDVVAGAVESFRQHGVERVVVVANPFIHQPYTYWLVHKAGMKIMWRHVRWIGFDKQSSQPWCRSWYRFLWQTIRLAVGKKHGFEGRQEPES